MGALCCCRLCGRGFRVQHEVEGQDHESLSDMKRLGLTRSEIDTFYRAFLRVDKEKEGSIKISDLLEHLGIYPSPVIMRVFTELDLSNDDMLNFREFTLSAWKFCARRREGIADMAFSMYDMNSSGDLSTKEISVMIKECYGEISDNHNVWTILECFDANEDSKVSRNEFVVQCKKHPALLAPAINFQVKLMGMISKKKSFWNKIYLTSGRTMHSRGVKVMYRIPDDLESIRSALITKRKDNTSHVKGYSYDNNMGIDPGKYKASGARRGKDKWKVDMAALKPKKKKVQLNDNRRQYGLFD